jgi:hypothetical protein
MACVAAALYASGLRSLGGLIAFGALCLAWSLTFPALWQALPKNAADFWYYLLAGVGVVLLFANASDQRDKIAAAQKYNSLSIDLSELEAKQKRIERAVTSPAEFFEKVKLRARTTYQEANPKACEDAIAANELSKQFRIDLNRPLDGRKKEFPALDVEPAIDWSACTLYASRHEFFELSNLASPDGLPAFLSKSRFKDFDGAIGLINGLTLSGFAEYVADGMTGKWKERADRLARELEKAREEYRDIGSTLTPSSGLEFKGIQHFVWPYLILMALAVKIARVNYSGAAGLDK